jgi:hypothetical protein
VPVHDPADESQRGVGHSGPVLVGYAVEQPRHVAAADIVYLSAAKARIHQPLKHRPLLVLYQDASRGKPHHRA